MNRSDLYRLIDSLPESKIPTVGSFIGYVLSQSGYEEVSNQAHDNAPLDDEEYSEEELESFQEALEEHRRGETLSHEEIKRRYNVA